MVRDATAIEAPPPCAASLLRKASRRMSQLIDDALSPVGLSGSQFAVLSELERRSDAPPSLQELSKALLVDRSSLAHTLRGLEKGGLAAVLEDPHDRRRRMIVLTARGKNMHGRARTLWLGAQQRFESLYGEAETADLRARLFEIAYDERLAVLPV